MKRWCDMASSACVLILMCSLSGCDAEDTSTDQANMMADVQTQPDASQDVERDTAPDLSEDTSSDAQPNAEEDTSVVPDMPDDTNPEPDVSEDTNPDVAADMDAEEDVAPDLPDNALTVNVSATHYQGIAPLTVQFEATIENGDEQVNVLWGFGDGETSTEQNPSHIYTTPGTFIATCAITNADGDTDTDTVEIVAEEEICQGTWEGDFEGDLQQLRGYTTVTGDVRIGGSQTFINLNALSCLTAIEGDLSILNNNTLQNLEGLESLTTIGERLLISDNLALQGLDALESLTNVGEDIAIQRNATLQTLEGLRSLNAVGGDVSIFNNPVLQNLNGLDALTTIEGLLLISDNPTLQSVHGLNALTSIGGVLSIYNNPTLQNLQGLELLAFLGGNLTIENNAQLCQNLVDALIEQLNMSMEPDPTIGNIANNMQCAPRCPERVWERNFVGDPQRLEGYTTVTGYVRIGSQQNITNLNTLSCLSSIEGDLIIINNALQNLEGLESLTTVGGKLDIQRNPMLQNLDGLSALTSIGDELEVHDNDQLCQSFVNDLIEQLNMSMEPDPTIDDITGNDGPCP